MKKHMAIIYNEKYVKTDEKRVVIAAYKAVALWQNRDYDKALVLIDNNIGHAKKLYEDDSNRNIWAYAKLTQIKGSIFHAKFELKKAKKSFEAAVKIWDTKNDLEEDELIDKLAVYNNAGIVCRKMGLYKEAEKIYDESIMIRKQMYYQNPEKYTLRYARAISNKATLKWRTCTYEELQNNESGKKEIVDLYAKSLQLRDSIDENKRDKAYIISLLIIHNDYAQYYERIKEYRNEDKELDKCDECIKTWKIEWGGGSFFFRSANAGNHC